MLVACDMAALESFRYSTDSNPRQQIEQNNFLARLGHNGTVAMDIPRQQLLKRWESLQDGTGLVRSAKLARLLSASGFLLVLLVTCAVAYRLSPIFARGYGATGTASGTGNG